MPDYRIRLATLDDLDVLVRHRVAMFTDMGVAVDVSGLDRAFREWLRATMPAGDYVAWLCETGTGETVAGGGISMLRWPPGPRPAPGDRLAFVYNVYTEPAHRQTRTCEVADGGHPRVVRRPGHRRRWHSTPRPTPASCTSPWATLRRPAR